MTDGENNKDKTSRITDAKRTVEKSPAADPPDQDKPVHKAPAETPPSRMTIIPENLIFPEIAGLELIP